LDLTTFAAFSAAILGVINLAVTTYYAGRRERLKWARDALAEAFYEFVDISYRTRDLALNQHRLLKRGTADEQRENARVLREQNIALRHAQTKVRLLAPRRTVDLADQLRVQIKDLSELLRPSMTDERFDELSGEISNQREKLIESAKSDMALKQ
jgi:hypothetical protein